MNTSKKTKFKGSTILAPVPAVVVTCGSVEKPNAITIGWTGIINSNPPKTYISVRPERFSYGLIKESGDFVINLTTKHIVKETDYLGVRSGRNEDKLKNLGLTVSPANEVSSPILDASPISIECKVTDVVPLGSHDMFVADIVCVNVADELIDESGRICLEKAGLIAYSHGEYFELGKKLAGFGHAVRKKTKKKKK